MRHIDLLDLRNLAEAVQDAVHLIAGVLKLCPQRIRLVAGHVVVGVISGHDHQGMKDNFLISFSFYLIQDALRVPLL